MKKKFEVCPKCGHSEEIKPICFICNNRPVVGQFKNSFYDRNPDYSEPYWWLSYQREGVRKPICYRCARHLQWEINTYRKEVFGSVYRNPRIKKKE